MDNGYHRGEGERAIEVQRAIDEAEWVVFRTRARLVLQEALKELTEMLEFLGQLEAKLSEEFSDAARERARRKLLEQLRLTRYAVAKSLEGARQTLRCYQ